MEDAPDCRSKLTGRQSSRLCLRNGQYKARDKLKPAYDVADVLCGLDIVSANVSQRGARAKQDTRDHLQVVHTVERRAKAPKCDTWSDTRQ